MEVIVLHRHLQMITSPHHQGTSHLQAKEVTKKKIPTPPAEKMYCQDWRLVWSQPAKRYTFRVIVNSWICRDWMEKPEKEMQKYILEKCHLHTFTSKDMRAYFFLLKNKRISHFTSQSVSSLFSQYFLVAAVWEIKNQFISAELFKTQQYLWSLLSSCILRRPQNFVKSPLVLPVK